MVVQADIIVTCSGLGREQKAHYRAAVASLGGAWSGELQMGGSQATTHLVVPPALGVKNSEKLLAARRHKLPVVSTAWLDDSIAAGEWADSREYALPSYSAETGHSATSDTSSPDGGASPEVEKLRAVSPARGATPDGAFLQAAPAAPASGDSLACADTLRSRGCLSCRMCACRPPQGGRPPAPPHRPAWVAGHSA